MRRRRSRLPSTPRRCAICGLMLKRFVLSPGCAAITPHAGEMARLLGRSREEIEDDPLRAAREASALLNAVVVMKGARTHIVDPKERAWLFQGGGSWPRHLRIR